MFGAFSLARPVSYRRHRIPHRGDRITTSHAREVLHRSIAEMLVRKARALTGREIRFLRKNAGLPAKKFATLLQVSPEHLSRVENGHYKSLGRSTDQLVRVIASLTLLGEPTRNSLLEVANLFESRTPLPRKRVFRLSRNKWKAAA